MNAPFKLETALERALSLTAQGFWIFPSWRKDRHVPGWPQRATRDAATIREWFTGPYKDCWPSIYTGKYGDGSQALIVVDVDPRGVAATESGVLDSLLPETRSHCTPRGGYHGFYTAPFPGVTQGVNVLADGIDIRSKGGLVHFGEGYAVERDDPIAPAPDSLIAKCGKLAPATAPADRAQDRIAPDQEQAFQRAESVMRAWPKIAEGERNNALRDFVYRIREACATDTDNTLILGLAFAVEVCEPPYPEDEARATIRSAIKSAQNAAGSKTVTADEFTALPETVAAIDKAAARGFTLAEAVQRFNGGKGARAQLVRGLLHVESYAVAFGPPKQGKTYVAGDLAYHIAAGRDWHGRKVTQGPVLYLAYEGVGSWGPRAAALDKFHGDVNVPFHIEPAAFDLSKPTGRRELGSLIATLKAGPFNNRAPVLIVIDTLARALGRWNGDENSAQDMNAFNDAITDLVKNTRACVLVIHHVGKNKSRGPRGSSALKGAIDTMLEIDNYTITTTDQRDMERGPSIGFRLKPITVGMDEAGEILSACVVQPAAASSKSAASYLRGKAARVYDVLCKLRPNNEAVADGEWEKASAAFLNPNRRSDWCDVRAIIQEAGLIVKTNGGLWVRRLYGGEGAPPLDPNTPIAEQMATTP